MNKIIRCIAMVGFLCSGALAAPSIDQTGWEKIMIDPATKKPIPTFNGLYQGQGVLAVYGENARILATYAEDADHDNQDYEKRGSKLISGSARDVYTGYRKGPALAAGLLGKGRVVFVPLQAWFETIGKLENGETPELISKKKMKKGQAIQLEHYPTTDSTFLKNSLSWLAKGKSASSLKIGTADQNLADGLEIGSVKLLSESDFASKLKSCDVFLGRVGHLNPEQIAALIKFAEGGGGLLIGDSPNRKLDDDKRGWYAYPLADQKGLHWYNKKVNSILEKAGMGLAYGIIDSMSCRQRFDTNVPVQWSREYGERMFEAIDALHAVSVDGDNSGVKYIKSPNYVAEAGMDEAVAVATMIGQQIFTMTQVLPDDHPYRRQLDEKLNYLKASSGRVVKGPIQKGLCMHEAVTQFKRPPDQIEKSRIADEFVGWPVTDKHPRLQAETFELTLGRDSTQITEFYAPAGETVTLDFSASPDVIGKGYNVHINVENSYHFFSELNYYRPPLFQQVVAIDRPIVKIASPYGGVIYIRYGAAASESEMKGGSVAEKDARAAAQMLGEGLDLKERLATISGAVRYPCFISGKHNNEDWERMLKEYPGYKVAGICRNVWIDIPRVHVEEFALEDIETWAMQFDCSYGRSFEVGPSIKTRTTRLTDICIPGREPGMPTRMGRMSSIDTAKCSIASVESGAGMTAHKVGHGMFGGKYAWARAIGTGTEFRANQMKWYEEYKKGVPGTRNSMCKIGADKDGITFHPYDVYSIIRAFGKFFEEQDGDYFSVEYDDAAIHTGAVAGGKGAPHLPFLYCKWMYDFGGMPGVNVWAQMNKDFANDIKAEKDDDPNTKAQYPLRNGDAHVHAEDHAVRWAQISGYNIIPYFEIFGFNISSKVKNMAIIKQSQDWLPMGSTYFNRPAELVKNTSITFDFTHAGDGGMTVALGRNRKLITPELLGIVTKPQFGSFKQTTSGIYEYTPKKDFAGRDLFEYKVRHPDTGQELIVPVYLQVLGIGETLDPDKALELYGRGALVEVYQKKENGNLVDVKRKGKKRGGKKKSGTKSTEDSSLMNFATLSETMVPQMSQLSIQGFESKAGVMGFARIRAYLEVPESGEYTFWVASYSDAILRMNTSGHDPAGAKIILEAERGPTFPQIFTNMDGEPNKTKPISLQKGKRYYVDLARAGSSRAGLWLGWSRNADADAPDEVVPNQYLIPAGRHMAMVPVDDEITVKVGESILISPLDNDLDHRFADSSNTRCLQVSFVGQAAIGTTERVGTRQIRYTPSPGFIGTEKFQYAIQSSTFRDRIRVGSITVHVK